MARLDLTALTHRLFFALLPPPELAAHVGAQRDALGLRGSVVRDDRLHITLFVTEDYDAGIPPALVERAMAAAAAVVVPPLRIVLNDTIHRHGIAMLRPSEPIPMLDLLQRRLATALGQAGVAARAPVIASARI